jgi:hypothetical protein
LRKLITGAVLAIGLVAAPLASGTASLASVKPAATTTCGSYCQDFSSELLGTSQIGNAYINGTGHVGNLVNLHLADNSRSNEDFTIQEVGEVRDFCRSENNPDGILPSTSVPCIDFRHYPVYEYDYSPFGNDSGLCAGTAGKPFNGMPVKLVDCGSTQGSLLIQQNNNASDSSPAGTGDLCAILNPSTNDGPDFSAYISGATQFFSHPFVVTVDSGTSHPTNQVKLTRQQTLTGGAIRDSQEFCYQSGPVS